MALSEGDSAIRWSPTKGKRTLGGRRKTISVHHERTCPPQGTFHVTNYPLIFATESSSGQHVCADKQANHQLRPNFPIQETRTLSMIPNPLKHLVISSLLRLLDPPLLVLTDNGKA